MAESNSNMEGADDLLAVDLDQVNEHLVFKAIQVAISHYGLTEAHLDGPTLIPKLRPIVLSKLLILVTRKGPKRLTIGVAIKLFDILVNCGSDFNKDSRVVHSNNFGVDVFNAAVKSGNQEMVKHVVKRGALPNSESGHYLICGFWGSNMFQPLLDLGLRVPESAKYNDLWIEQIIQCIDYGHFEKLKLLIQSGLDLRAIVQENPFFARNYFRLVANNETGLYDHLTQSGLENAELINEINTFTGYLLTMQMALEFLIPYGLKLTEEGLEELVEGGSFLTLALICAKFSGVGVLPELILPAAVELGALIVDGKLPNPVASYGISLMRQLARRIPSTVQQWEPFLRELEFLYRGKYQDDGKAAEVPKLADFSVDSIRNYIVGQGGNLCETLSRLSIPEKLLNYILMEDLQSMNRVELEVMDIFNVRD